MKYLGHKTILYLILLSNFYAWGSNSQNPWVDREATSGNLQYYDELLLDGKLRDTYSALSGYLTDPYVGNDQSDFLKSSKLAFQKDNALDSIPRILTLKESLIIQNGVEQRARAIRAFLKDHYSGKRYYAKANIIPEDVVNRIISRTGESKFDGLVNPYELSFMYGPDIIRDAHGQWRVIEDNPGFIGGLGDLKLAYDLILQKHPNLEKYFTFADPMQFYKSVALAYKEIGLRFGGKTILYMTPPYADNEDQRIEKLFQQFGIVTITPKSDQKLVITNDQVYIKRYHDGKYIKEKVGFIFLNGEHAWLDNTHKAAKLRNIIEASSEYLKEKKASPKIAKQISEVLLTVDEKTQLPDVKKLEQLLIKADYLDTEKSHAAGLLKLIIENKVGSNYSPGVDFIGDKEFYVYVEQLIKHYLHEDPILKNIPTQKFINEQTGVLDEKLISLVSKSKDEYVIKKVDGRGGDSVWVGSKTSQLELDAVLERVRTNPSVYIVQKFMHLSVLGQNIVDLRAISAVLPNRVIVAETPWGRGLPMNGNGKVNLSDKGREVTVLSIKSNKDISRLCEKVLNL